MSRQVMTDEEIRTHYGKMWSEKPTGTITHFGFVAGAQWMRDKASLLLKEKDEEIDRLKDIIAEQEIKYVRNKTGYE